MVYHQRKSTTFMDNLWQVFAVMGFFDGKVKQNVDLDKNVIILKINWSSCYIIIKYRTIEIPIISTTKM